ncbi:reprolysin-like metallopeptidase [Corynebacterium sp. Marseille-P4321]|uniref:reprolysin-like metallopeptidase n=1 Tax=Corynebacterium sp. Marseille-P4321 TaxID=2736603 RepID=UPI00158AA6C2|nr:hypothetical protein [Corynebacterium sp. Marseille-P4321]
MSLRTTIATVLAATLALTGMQATPASAAAAAQADEYVISSGAALGGPGNLDDEISAADIAEMIINDANTGAEVDGVDELVDIDGVEAGALTDSDGDGIPDVWETHGVTLEDGTVLPLPQWGADPNRADIFLQLNWMASEYETLACHTDAPKADEATCARANRKTYRPTKRILDEIVDKFAEHDYTLHIDAGVTYTNIDNYPQFFGGETEDYARYAFSGVNQAVGLLKNQKNLLGARQHLFRVGVIGDQMGPRDYSTGVATVGGNSFYVANHAGMSTQDELRNTILHEFGHTLGLRHNGHKDYVKGLNNNVMHPDYHSVMSYNHQWNHFDYSTTAYTRTDAGVTRTIPADWDVLSPANHTIGKADAYLGGELTDEDRDAIAENHNAQAQAAAAEEANYTARIRNTIPATITTNPSDAADVVVEVENPGIDLATYTIEAAFPGGGAKETITLAANQAKTLTFSITPAKKYTNLPVNITITNTDTNTVVANTATTIQTNNTRTLEGANAGNTQANNQANNTANQAADQAVKQLDNAKNEVENGGEVNIAAIIIPVIIALIAAIGAAGFALANN